MRFDRAALGVAAALWLGLLLALHLRLRDMAFDDAYIHLRIARNLIRFGQAFFNPGERVMATSSPLWTILLGVLQVPNHVAALPVAEALLVWCCAVLAFLICRGTFRPDGERRSAWRAALAPVAALLITAVMLTSSLGLMETPLAIAFLLGAWWNALKGGRAALPLLALAACTRLELLPLLLFACFAWLWARKGARPVAAAGSIVAAAACWTWWQFRALLPNSMRAKRLGYGYTVRQTAEQFVPLRLRAEVPAIALLLFVAIVAWSVIGSRAAWGRRAGDGRAGRMRAGDGRALVAAEVLPLAAVVWALLVQLQYLGNRTVLFEWYKPLYAVPMVLGLLLLQPDAGWSRAAGAGFAVVQAAFLLLLITSPLTAATRVLRAAVQQTPLAKSSLDGGDSARVQAYLQLGSVLRVVCPGGTLMTPEIGALGWAYDGYVYDAFGIASPGALRYQPLRSGTGRGGVPAGYVASTLPDLIVSYTVLDTEVRGDAELTSRYDLLQLPPSPRSHRGGALDAGWHGSRYLDVWTRKDGACPVAVVTDAVRRKLE